MITDDLMTLPTMTEDAARRLRTFGIPTRTALHEQIAYQPGVVAYAGDVSMKRVETWLRDLERGIKVEEGKA